MTGTKCSVPWCERAVAAREKGDIHGRVDDAMKKIGGDICPGRAYLETTMIDPFGRHITYLRVSVTDRCDFRCVYCMAEEMSFLPKRELLTLEELDRVCS